MFNPFKNRPVQDSSAVVITGGTITGTTISGGSVDPDTLIMSDSTPVNAVAASKVLTIGTNPVEAATVTIGGQVYKFRTDIGAGVKAEQTLTFNAELPHDGDTVILGLTTYTFKTVVAVAGDVLIEATVTATIDNLVAAVDGGAGEGVKYGTGTSDIGAVVTPTKPTADTFKVVYYVVGTLGNGFDTLGTLTHATWGDITLKGGIEPQAANDVLIGLTVEISIDNLVLAISAGAGGGTNYGTGTVANAYVTAAKASASSMIVTNKIKGIIGNSTAIAEGLADGSWAGGATFLSGGIDGTVGVADEIRFDDDYMYRCTAVNTTADTNWIKTPIGFDFDGIAITGGTINGTSIGASTPAPVNATTLEFDSLVLPNAPTANQILKFNGTIWEAADSATTASAGGTNFFLTDSDTAIEGLSRANPCIVTWTDHGLVDGGHRVKFEGITQAGWTALNSVSPAANLWHTATVINSSTFSIPVDTSGYAGDYVPATDPGMYSHGKLLNTPDGTISESIDAGQSTGNVESLIDVYATQSALGRTTIEGGEWTFDTWAYASSATDTNIIVIRVLKRSAAGVETELFNVSTSDLGNSVLLYRTATVQPAFTILATDHLVVRYYAKSNRGGGLFRQIYLVHGGTTHYSLIKSPMAVAHNQLGGLNSGNYYHLSGPQSAPGEIGRTTPSTGSFSPSVSVGPAIITTFAGTVSTSGSSTTVVFSSAADAILAGYDATNPILGTTLITAGPFTRYIQSWTNSTTCVVDSVVTLGAGTAITSVQLPIAVFKNSAGVVTGYMLASGSMRFTQTPGDLKAAPTIAFGDGDTGFYESADDIIYLTFAGVARWVLENGSIYSIESGGPFLERSGTTDTTHVHYGFNGDPNTGIYRVSADILALVTGGAERIRCDASGNILLGALTAAGTNAAKVLGMGVGTAPTTSPADMSQIWTEDTKAVAANNDFHMRNEAGDTGPVGFAVSPERVKTSTIALTLAECVGKFLNNYGQTDDCTLTLPAAAVNLAFDFVAGTTVAKYLRFDPNASDSVYLDGVTTGDGKYIGVSSVALGNAISFRTFQTGASTYDWFATTGSGPWVAEA